MTTPSTTLVRLAHVSDIHVGLPVRWSWRDWLSKRLTGWINLRYMGRGRRFREAERVLHAMADDLARRRPDAVVFSGDASALGFPEEIARAAQLLRPGELPGVAIPGNHDYYVPADERSGAFERHFAPWQQGERAEGAVYPFARRVGPLWLVCVNAAAGNWVPWQASGRVDAEQLRRLEQLLARLEAGPRILVVHFPLARPDGRPETDWHGLHDARTLVEVARQGGVCLWLHGHVHAIYCLDDPAVAPFPTIGAGSGTQLGQAGYNEYVIEGHRLRAVRRSFDPGSGQFQDGQRFEVTLPIQLALSGPTG